MNTPLTEKRRKEIASLSRKKFRDRLGQTVVEGLRSVESAVLAGAPLVEIVVSESASHEPQTTSLLERISVPIHIVEDRESARLSDVETSQGILAVVDIPPSSPAVLVRCRTVLALDGVQDPGNVGTIIRTAAWFGIDAIVAGSGTADLYGPKVIRSAMGGLWDVTLVRSEELARVLVNLREGGFTIYGADLEGVDARQWEPRVPSALVLGSEAHGLSTPVGAQVDRRVTIRGVTGRRGAESLNVAIAAGILVSRWSSI